MKNDQIKYVVVSSAFSTLFTLSIGFGMLYAEAIMPIGDWRWLVLMGICILTSLAFNWKDRLMVKRVWKAVRGLDDDNPPNVPTSLIEEVDYIGAYDIIDRYIAPALQDLRVQAKIAIRNDFIKHFDKMTGAKLGEHQYNGTLLHQWMQSNAARFLVEHRGKMR